MVAEISHPAAAKTRCVRASDGSQDSRGCSQGASVNSNGKLCPAASGTVSYINNKRKIRL